MVEVGKYTRETLKYVLGATVVYVPSVTQENAVEQHSLSWGPKQTQHISREGTYRSCQRHESLLLYDLLTTGRHLLGVFVFNKPKVKVCAVRTTYATTDNNCVITRSKHDCTSSQMHFWLLLYRLLFTYKRRWSFPCARKCEGQLQTLQSVSVGFFTLPSFIPTARCCSWSLKICDCQTVVFA